MKSWSSANNYAIGNGVLKKYSGSDEYLEIEQSDGIIEIGERAFAEYYRIKSIVIPEGVVKIGKSAFSNCISLEKVVFPSTLREISDRAFCFCKKLKKIELPKDIEILGENAFRECEVLEEVAFSSTLNAIVRSKKEDFLKMLQKTKNWRIRTVNRLMMALFLKHYGIFQTALFVDAGCLKE